MNQEITGTASENAPLASDFTVLLSSTRRGARLARLLACEHLRSRGLPAEVVAHVVAELATNAATHGCVPGRDFRLTIAVHGDVVRVEVADTCGERRPVVRQAAADGESGRGLVLVEALAEKWGVSDGPFPRKTVWAEVRVTGT